KTPARKKAAAGSMRVAGVKRGPLPDFVPPTLATLVDNPPSGAQWVHEIKIDGYRVFARRRNGKVTLLTRNALDWTGRFKPIADAVAKLPGGDLALDGEVAVLDQNGGSSFAALQDALSHGDTKPLRYIVFDLLYRDGEDWRGAALTERKEALRDLLKNTRGPLVYSDDVVAQGGEVFQQACNLKLEGVISKRTDVPYYEGGTRHRRAGDRLLRRREAPLRRPRRHRLRPSQRARPRQAVEAAGHRSRAFHRPAERGAARRALGRARPRLRDCLPQLDVGRRAAPSFLPRSTRRQAGEEREARARDARGQGRERSRKGRSAGRTSRDNEQRAQRPGEDRRRRDLASRSRDFPRSRHHQAATHRILRERRRVDPAAYRQPAAELAALSRQHCRRMLLPEAFLDRHE